MSSTLSLSMTRQVTVNGVAHNKTMEKDITVDGRILSNSQVEVAAGAVKTILNTADTDYSGVLAASGGTADFDYLEVYCDSAVDAADTTFVELGGAVGGDDYLAFELRSGSWLCVINGDAVYEGRTGNGLATYANLGSIGNIDSVRVVNAGASVAKFSIFAIT